MHIELPRHFFGVQTIASFSMGILDLYILEKFSLCQNENPGQSVL
jgi:hypothetical protein